MRLTISPLNPRTLATSMRICDGRPAAAPVARTAPGDRLGSGEEAVMDRRKGFTLIELLVVITIISILAGLGVLFVSMGPCPQAGKRSLLSPLYIWQAMPICLRFDMHLARRARSSSS